MLNYYLIFRRFKNCPYKDMINLGQSSTHHIPNRPDYKYKDTIFFQSNFFYVSKSRKQILHNVSDFFLFFFLYFNQHCAVYIRFLKRLS